MSWVINEMSGNIPFKKSEEKKRQLITCVSLNHMGFVFNGNRVEINSQSEQTRWKKISSSLFVFRHIL